MLYKHLFGITVLISQIYLTFNAPNEMDPLKLSSP